MMPDSDSISGGGTAPGDTALDWRAQATPLCDADMVRSAANAAEFFYVLAGSLASASGELVRNAIKFADWAARSGDEELIWSAEKMFFKQVLFKPLPLESAIRHGATELLTPRLDLVWPPLTRFPKVDVSRGYSAELEPFRVLSVRDTGEPGRLIDIRSPQYAVARTSPAIAVFAEQVYQLKTIVCVRSLDDVIEDVPFEMVKLLGHERPSLESTLEHLLAKE